MKKLLLIAICIYSFNIYSQNVPDTLDYFPDTLNFYEIVEIIESNLTVPPSLPLDSTEEDSTTFFGEDGFVSNYLRFYKFWESRVDKDGNFSAYTSSLKDYIENHNTVCPPLYSEHVSWNCLGPFNSEGANQLQNQGMVHSITPHPEYGSTNDLDGDGVINDKTILAGSRSGGIFITYDDGLNWKNTTDDERFSTFGAASIVFHPQNFNKVFCATGNSAGYHYKQFGRFGLGATTYGIGVIGSTDGGKTWEICYSPYEIAEGQGNPISELLILPSSTDQITKILAISKHGLHKCVGDPFDENSWVEKLKGTFHDIEVDPNNENIVWVTTSSRWTGAPYPYNAKLYRSDDAGESWNQVSVPFPTDPDIGSTPDLISITITSNSIVYIRALFSPTIALLGKRSVYMSTTDLGNTWSLFTNTSQDPLFKHGTDFRNISFQCSLISDERIYVAEQTRLKRLVLDIQNKEVISDNNIAGSLHDDVRNITAFKNGSFGSGSDIIFVGTDGGIAKVTDNGNTVNDITGNGLVIGQYYNIGGTHKDPDYFFAGAQDGSINRYMNGQWDETTYPGGDEFEYLINPDNIDIVHGTGNDTYNKSLNRFNSPNASAFGPEDDKYARGFPMIFHPNDPETIFIGRFNLFYSQNGGGSINNWNEIVLNEAHRISCLGISEDDPSILYYAKAGNYPHNSDAGLYSINWLSPGIPELLHKDVNNNNNSLGNALNEVGITDIAVNPDDVNKIWVTCANLSEGVKVFHGIKTGGTWIWNNISGCLPNFPVNSIVYDEKSTNDRIFVGTDVGVFFKDNLMTDWEYLGYGQPGHKIFDMEINYCANKLRVATFGRGIWEAGLKDIELIIDQNTVWSQTNQGTNTIKIENNIRINPGATLELNEIKIIMPAGARIIVEKGARLILDEAYITSSDEYCDNLWQGIVVKGNKTDDQPDRHDVYSFGTNAVGNYPSQSSHHGVVVIKENLVTNTAWSRTTIRNARFGISSVDGGIIMAEEADFINNRKAIEFMRYEKDVSISKFRDCVFKYDNDMPFEADALVTLWRHNGVIFKGCEFINDNYETFPLKEGSSYAMMENFGAGIVSIDADYKILPICTRVDGICDETLNDFKPCIFYGFYRGIKADFTTYFPSTVSSRIKINHAKFENNQRALLFKKALTPSVTYSDFSFDNEWFNNLRDAQTFNIAHFTHSIYLEGSKYYSIEENEFNSVNLSCDGNPPCNVNWGIIVHNGHNFNTRIYRNKFTDLIGGIGSLGKNGRFSVNNPQENRGLRLKCNEFYGNNMDIGVFKDFTFEAAVFLGFQVFKNINPKIHPQQGRCVFTVNPLEDSKKPANNRYSQGTTNIWFGLESHIWANATTPPTTFTHPISPMEYIPTIYSASIIAEPCIVEITPESCPISGNVDDFYMKDQISMIDDDREDLLIEWQEVKHSAEEFLAELENATGANIDAVYELIELEEIIRPEVLEAAISHYAATYDLPGLKSALITHSDLEESVILELIDAYLPFTQQDINDIIIAQQQNSPYSELINSIIDYDTEREYWISRLAAFYIDTNRVDDLIRDLEEDTMPYSKNMLLGLYATYKNPDDANLLLDEVYPQNGDCMQCRQYWHWLINRYPDELPADTIIDMLKAILEYETEVTAFAIASLEEIEGVQYQEGFPDESEVTVKASIQKEDLWDKVRRIDEQLLNIEPNPANNRVTISGVSTETTAEINLTDISGKALWSKVIHDKEFSFSIDISHFPTGLYLVNMKGGNKLITGNKLLIE